MNEQATAGLHQLPDLPYPEDALEPYVDAETVRLHHGKHHASYVKKLNAAVSGIPELRTRDAYWLVQNLAQVPRRIRTTVRNNAGGHLNHSLFWRAMCPNSSAAPSGLLADAIEQDLGGFERFKADFVAAGVKQFGSGWVWLVRERADSGKLSILTTANHDTPLCDGQSPVLVNDLWEHAYYLRYQDRRKDYLEAWWSVVDWDEAGRLYEGPNKAALGRWEGEGGSIA